MTQQVYIDNCSIERLTDILIELSAKRVFLVRGGLSYETSGAESVITDIMLNLGCCVVEFSDFKENPKYEDMSKGIELLKTADADVILAVGGGSVMDMAKLIRFFYSYDGDVTGKEFSFNSKSLLPLIVVPTTAGTGAEATHFSVLYKDNTKYSVAHEDILPNYVIIYPIFTYNNSRYLSACTGFDALAQAIEAYWNLNATAESDIYAEKAIKMLWDNLPKVVNKPADRVRDTVSEGSYWAGRAINITKTTAPHAFSYPFTTYYNYPHGHAVALTFPYFMHLNCVCNRDRERVDRLLKIIGLSITDDLQKIFQEYLSNIGLKIREAETIDWDDVIDKVNLERLKNNPVKVDKKELKTYLSDLK